MGGQSSTTKKTKITKELTVSISVLILTKNEQQDLPGCLDSVAWADDIFVLDSFSTDKTIEVANNYGVHVKQRTFDGYASQRNFGLNLPFKHEWILILDADERIPPQLKREIEEFIKNPPGQISACRFRRRDIWWGVWLKHSQISPYFIRLVKKGHAYYEREINEVLFVQGDVWDLKESFDHFPFSKGLDHWLSKHNLYSRMEANLILENAIVKPSLWTAFFGKDFNERRVHQKAIFYRMPARPIVKLIYMLVWRRGVFDGVAGIRYAVLQSIYEYLIVLKVKEKAFESLDAKVP